MNDLQAAAIQIADIHKRGKVPILCGGTCYYYEAVVSETLLDDGTELATGMGMAGGWGT